MKSTTGILALGTVLIFGSLGLFSFSPNIDISYSDLCPIHNTRTSAVGYVRQTVVDIQVSMTFQTEGEAPTSYEMMWGGSGMILDQAGRVLTNWHVVDDQRVPLKRDYTVTLFDGRVFKAVFLRSDMAKDLGLLQILDPPEGLWWAVLASYEPVHGQDVLVFGSPRGLRGSVSHGILSALDRTIQVRICRGGPVQAVEYSGMLQTDAPINPGNSGGPLTDIWGRVIGLVNAGGSGDGMGFAVPVSSIRKFLGLP